MSALLAQKSSAARAMASRQRGNSPMMRAMTTRRDLMLERRMVNSNEALRKALLASHKAEKGRDTREERQTQTQRLVDNRDKREVVSLLTRIANKLENLDRANRGLGNLASGVMGAGVMGRMFGRMAEAGTQVGAGARRGMVKDANGRWRDAATGRYAKAPQVGKFGRGLGAVGRVGGKILNSPAGRIGMQAGRLGLNVLGKFALPVAAGMAIYSGVHGMRHADDILGRTANAQDRAAVGVAEAVNSVLMGLPNWISKKVFGQSFSKLMVDGLEDVGDKINEKVKDSIDSVKATLGRGFGAISTTFHRTLEGFNNYGKDIARAGDSLVSAVKSRDMKGAIDALGKLSFLLLAKPVIKTGQAAAKVTTAAKQGAVEVGGKIATATVESAKTATTTVKGWMGLGSTSAKYESGKRGVTAISSGKGDPGGASYGKYQLSSNKGTLGAYLKQSGYGAQFAGLRPGTKEFNAKWLELAKNDPKFAESQHEFIKRTHYDPAAKYASRMGFNMSNKGVQDAIWSASVQHGGVNKIIKEAASTPGWAQLSDEQKLRRFYEVRSNYAVTNMRRDGASASQIASVRDRYTREVNDVVMLSRAPGMGETNIQVANKMPTAKPVSKPTPAMSTSAPTQTAKAPAAAIKASPVPTTLVSERPQAPEPAMTPAKDIKGVQDNLRALMEQAKVEPTVKPKSQPSMSRGGLPSLADIADRPPIELQLVSTTTYHRG